MQKLKLFYLIKFSQHHISFNGTINKISNFNPYCFQQMTRILIKNFIPLFSFFLAGHQASAQIQQWQWAQSGNGKSAEYVSSVITDVSGNIYISGYFNSDSIFFGDSVLVNHGNDDIFLLCYDTYGNVIWAKGYGSTGNDYCGNQLSTDNSGNIYMTGYWGGDTIFFDSEMLVGKGYDDIFIIKISPDGNVVWAKSFGGNDFDWGLGIACDINENIYITGFFDSDTITFGNDTIYNTGSDDLFITKLNNTGNALWTVTADGSSVDVGTHLKTNLNDEVILCGYFQSSFIVLGSDTLYNSGGSDPFIAKLNASGNFQWANSIQGDNNDFIRGLAVSKDDEVLMDGSFFSDTLTIGLSQFVNHGGNDVFFTKFDAFGNPLWSKSTGGTDWDLAMSLTLDTLDNVYIGGYFRSPSILFGTTTLTNSGASNIFIVKYDLDGNVEWAKKAGGTYSDEAIGAAADAMGNIYLTGNFASGIISFESNTLYNAGFTDVFLAKMTTENTGLEINNNNNFNFNIFPNPSAGHVVITFSLSSEQFVNIDVYNILGEKSDEILKEGLLGAGTYSYLVSLPNGIYCITLSMNKKSISKLLVIQ